VTSCGLADPSILLAGRAARAMDCLTNGDRSLGVAVSGGSDSIALLLLAAEWARAAGVRLEAATLDHGLRPEAAGEARGVAGVCAMLQLRHETLVWRRSPPGAGILVSQADARRVRHGLLAAWARDRGLATLAFGHTRDDRIETFLIRARAGSGWRGLAGPMPSSPSPVWPEGAGVRLVRPLLAFTREELRAELRRRAVLWVDDPTNLDLRYERVRMRALAARLGAPTRAAVTRIMDQLTLLRASVAAGAREAMADVRLEGGEAWLDATVFRSLGAEVRLRLAEALILAAGGAAGPLRVQRLERLVERIAAPGGLGGGATLAGARIRETQGAIRIGPAPARGAGGAIPALDSTRAAALLANPCASALDV